MDTEDPVLIRLLCSGDSSVRVFLLTDILSLPLDDNYDMSAFHETNPKVGVALEHKRSTREVPAFACTSLVLPYFACTSFRVYFLPHKNFN